jgi:hypothetical protein
VLLQSIGGTCAVGLDPKKVQNVFSVNFHPKVLLKVQLKDVHETVKKFLFLWKSQIVLFLMTTFFVESWYLLFWN